MSGFVGDVRGAWRLFSRYRGTSLLILLTLLLGLGANAAIFSVARGVLLRPLPYDEPDRVVLIWNRAEPIAPGSMGHGLATPRWFREIRVRQRSFSSVAAIELWDGNPSASFDLASSQGAERLRGAFVTPNFFTTVGIRAAAGRVFSDDDGDEVAVISHDLWRRRFIDSTDPIGGQLELATGRGRERTTRRLTIVGVLPPRVQFTYPESTDVWLPLPRQRLENPRMQDAILYRMVARLLPGVTLQQAHEDLAATKAGIAADLKRNMERVTFWVERVHENAVGATRPAVRLLNSVALLVFVVACLNVAALLLAQAVERRRDIALQLALGASRWRIGRQLLTESALLASLAGVSSVTVVVVLQPLLRAALPASIPRVQEIGVDLVTLGSMSVLVTLAVVLAAILPAWRSSAIDPGAEIEQSGRTATVSRGAVAWRHGVVTLQVSAVVVLLVGGGLLLHSFWKLQRLDLGFDGRRVFTAEMRLLDPRYFDELRLKAFQDELLVRVRALPGVQHASITSSVPLRGVDWTYGFTHRGERTAAKERDVDPDYFKVMGIPLLDGRTFSLADVSSSIPVAIVSRSLAEDLFPGQNAVGQRLDLSPERQLEIVGVVGDVRNVRVEEEAEPAYYVPRAQRSTEIICLVARTAEGTPDLGPQVRAIVASIDPMQPVMNATTLDRIVSGSIADRGLYTFATVAFALVTLLLAVAGLYGVTSYSITARTREIGVRAALGAAPVRLVAMLIAQAAQPVVFGLGIGLIVALWAGRLIERFLFDVRTFDLLTYLTAMCLVLGLAFIACLVPAVRAARVSPVLALRQE